MAKVLGNFEEFVLYAVLQLADNAYGVTIRREIARRTGQFVTFGALYTTLERLEGKGYLSSWMGDPTPERGGRAKKFFRVQAEGLNALRHAHEAHARMAAGLEPIMEAL